MEWFLPWAAEIQRVLKPSGSFVLNINDCVVQGERHLYVFDVVCAMRRSLGLRYIERYLWVKTSAFPGRFRLRFRDHTEYLFHFARSLHFKIRHDAVKVPVRPGTVQRIERARRRAEGRRWSQNGSALSLDLARMPTDLALPGNVIWAHPETHVRGHPAPGPLALPDFFIRALTDPGDLVVDPFAGSGTTGVAAVQSGRRFLGWEAVASYAELARSRIAGSVPNG